MATTTNLFDLLSGIGKSEQLQTLKKKTKPKKAKKPDTALLANGVHEDIPVSPRAAAASEVAESSISVLPEAHVIKPPAQTQYVVIEASEAVAICERAAREAKSLSDKIKLWKDWTRQAADRSGRGLKYKDADGGYLDFTQVVVRSKGLEISIESCLASGLTQDKEPVLSQLLSTFLPADRSHLAPALASTLIRISALFTLESPDTLSTAQRAVFATIAALKLPGSGSSDASASAAGGGGSAAGWLARVATVEKEVATLNAAALKLQQGAGNGVTREQTQNMKQVLALFEEKFQLLQPENIPAAKSASSARVSPCEKGLSDLRAIISSHMQQARQNSNSSSDISPAAQRSAALASCRREEAILDARTAELLGEVRTLEARLHGLHMEQSELQVKRQQVQHMRAGLDSSVVGSKGGRAQPQGEGLGDAHYRDELAAVEALHCLMDPSRSANNGSSHQQADQVAAVVASQAEASVDLVSQGVAYLELALRAMREMPAKLAFCRTRCSQAEKLFALGAMSAASSSAAATGTPVVGARQKQEAEKLLAETLKSADDLVMGSEQVWNDMHLRYDALMRFSPPAATHVATLVRSVDALCTQVREAHAVMLAEPAPAAPAPAAQPRPQSQNRQQRQGQSPAAAAAAAPQAAQQAVSRSESPQAVPIPAAVPKTEHKPQQERRPAAATNISAGLQQPAAAAAMAALLPKVPQQQALNSKPTVERAAPAPRAAVVQLVAASHNSSAAPAPPPVSNGSQATTAPHHPSPAPTATRTPIVAPTAAAAQAPAAAVAQQMSNSGPASVHASSNIADDSAAAAVVTEPAAKPAPAAPPRSWGKVAVAPITASSDDSLPTPAEAALALSTSDADGPKEGTSANARRGGPRSGGGARLPRA